MRGRESMLIRLLFIRMYLTPLHASVGLNDRLSIPRLACVASIVRNCVTEP
jgi:hypothetical protein